MPLDLPQTPEAEEMIKRLASAGWIKGWARKDPNSYAIEFTEKGKQRAAWIVALYEELRPTDRDLSTLFALIRAFVRPKGKSDGQ